MQPEMVINMSVANKCVFVQTARSPNRTHALLFHAQALELCCVSPGPHRVPESDAPVQAQLCPTLDEMLQTEFWVFGNIFEWAPQPVVSQNSNNIIKMKQNMRK